MDAQARQERLDAVRQLVEQANKLSQSGDTAAARRRLDEAGMSLTPLGDDDDVARLAVAASVHEGKGQIALSVGRLDEAYFQLTQAVDLRNREGRVSGEPRLLNLAISHMNLSSACAQLERSDEALAENERALAALDGLGDAPTAKFMRVAFLQARAMLFATLGDADQSITYYDHAIEVAEGLLTEDDAAEELPELLTQIRISASVTRHEHDRHAEARDQALRASAEAWDRFEVTGSDHAIGQYLTSEMNLVAFCEAGGDFAGAEDALFRVLKLVGPQAEVLARGRQLYQALLRLDDAALEAGNLPRDEVEESLGEIERMIAEAAQA